MGLRDRRGEGDAAVAIEGEEVLAAEASGKVGREKERDGEQHRDDEEAAPVHAALQ
jgi:hypothetical protein